MKQDYYNDDPIVKPNFTQPNMGLINDDNYCEKVDYNNLQNPQNFLNSMNFLTDYNADGLVRQDVIKQIGKDMLSDDISKDMNKTEFNTRFVEIPIETQLIFTKKTRFHYFHEYNKNLFCKTQMYNHIPGHGSLTRKDLNVVAVINYAKRMKQKPHCFDPEKFFPKSYRLDQKEECVKFFSFINTPEYAKLKEKEPVVFLQKISWGSSRGNGVEILDDDKEHRIRRKYENGQLCGEIIDNVMMQKYIYNPLTVDNHKFDFRIYMLVASTNPLILFYHDGFLRISLLKYDKNAKEKSVHLTNTALSKDIFNNAEQYYNQTGMTEEQMKDYQMWTMEKLQEYLLSKVRLLKQINFTIHSLNFY